MDRRRSHAPTTPLAWLVVLLGLAAGACAEHHVRLQFPNASPGEKFVCHPVTSQEVRCEPATTIDPALENQAHTAFVNLPLECEGRFSQITIHDSGSSEPTVMVTCAPPESPVE